MALLLYDHVLTFPGEVKLIWTRRWSGVTMLFVVNRYFALLDKAFLLVDSFPWPNQTDQVSTFFFTTFVCMLTTLILFSALRVYAIWNRDWKPCIPVLAIGLVVPGINLVRSLATHSCAIASDALVL
ncbi:hypothetical protein B0H21DRAFT_840997, partial [Amylocystis lapponica]